MRALLLILALGAPALGLQLITPPPLPGADAAEPLRLLRAVFAETEAGPRGGHEPHSQDPGEVARARLTAGALAPALLWLPFYALGELWAGGAGAGREASGPLRAVALASLAYGLAGLWLVNRVVAAMLTRHAAFLSVFLLLYGTFLYWYLVFEPLTTSAASFFLAAAVLATWWGGRTGLSLRRALGLGLLVGLAASIRWPSAALLLLPILSRERRPGLARAGLLLAGFALGAFPEWVLSASALGSGRGMSPGFDGPFLLEGLFSSRHGLLFWSPLLWAGLLGFVPLWRKPRGAPAGALAATLLAMIWLSVCCGSWWASGAFPNQRLDAALPLLAVGIGAAASWLNSAAVRRPGRLLALGGAGLALWNFLFMEQYRRTLIPRDDTVSFARVAELNAGILAEWTGSPVAWPANWIFARQSGLPAARYDLLVGKRLFQNPGGLGGIIDIGADLERDDALLGGHWSVRRPCGESRCRDVAGRALVFAPLSRAQDLELTVRARGSGELGLAVNGFPVAVLPLDAELAELRVRIPAQQLRRGPNEIAFLAVRGGTAQIDRLSFRQQVP